MHLRHHSTTLCTSQQQHHSATWLVAVGCYAPIPPCPSRTSHAGLCGTHARAWHLCPPPKPNCPTPSTQSYTFLYHSYPTLLSIPHPHIRVSIPTISWPLALHCNGSTGRIQTSAGGHRALYNLWLPPHTCAKPSLEISPSCGTKNSNGWSQTKVTGADRASH